MFINVSSSFLSFSLPFHRAAPPEVAESKQCCYVTPTIPDSEFALHIQCHGECWSALPPRHFWASCDPRGTEMEKPQINSP